MFKLWTYTHTMKVNICNEACFLCNSSHVSNYLFDFSVSESKSYCLMTIMGFIVEKLSVCTAILFCLHIYKISAFPDLYFANTNACSCLYMVPRQLIRKHLMFLCW
jgi:hypothetical protein